MQQQLYHKSLFAVKLSGSGGSKYNLLCLQWVIRRPTCCTDTSAEPPNLPASSSRGLPGPRPGHGDSVCTLKMDDEEPGGTVLREPCSARVPRPVGLPRAPLVSRGAPVLVTPDLGTPAAGDPAKGGADCCEVMRALTPSPPLRPPTTARPGVYRTRDEAGILVPKSKP